MRVPAFVPSAMGAMIAAVIVVGALHAVHAAEWREPTTLPPAGNPAGFVWTQDQGASPQLGGEFNIEGGGSMGGPLKVVGMSVFGNARLDLGADAGDQNVIYGVAQRSLMHSADALLLLQTADDAGVVTDRLRVDRDGNLSTTTGKVQANQLCINSDCKGSWDAVAPAGVLLQAETPGTAQTGNFNVSGTGQMGALSVVNSLELKGGGFLEFNTHGSNTGIVDSPLYMNSDGSLHIRIDTNDSTDGINDASTFSVNNGANTTVLTVSETGTMTLGGTDQKMNNVAKVVGASRDEVQFNANGLELYLAPGSAGRQAGLRIDTVGFAGSYANIWHDGSKIRIVDSGMDATSGVSIDAVPSGPGALQAAFSVNPLRANANSALFGLAVGGAEMFRVDAEGDVSVSGQLFFGTNLRPTIDATVKIPALSTTYFASVDGSSLTTLNASNLSSGTVPDARIATTIPRLTNVTTFTGVPRGAGVTQASLVVNPVSATAGYTLLGAAVNGVEKLRLDAAGNMAIAGAVTTSGDATVGGNLIMNGAKLLVGGAAGRPVLAGLRKVTATCVGAFSCVATCGASEVSTGGGCGITGSGSLTASYPVQTNNWSCSTTVATSITVAVLCATPAQ